MLILLTDSGVFSALHNYFLYLWLVRCRQKSHYNSVVNPLWFFRKLNIAFQEEVLSPSDRDIEEESHNCNEDCRGKSGRKYNGRVYQFALQNPEVIL